MRRVQRFIAETLDAVDDAAAIMRVHPRVILREYTVREVGRVTSAFYRTHFPQYTQQREREPREYERAIVEQLKGQAKHGP